VVMQLGLSCRDQGHACADAKTNKFMYTHAIIHCESIKRVANFTHPYAAVLLLDLRIKRT